MKRVAFCPLSPLFLMPTKEINEAVAELELDAASVEKIGSRREGSLHEQQQRDREFVAELLRNRPGGISLAKHEKTA